MFVLLANGFLNMPAPYNLLTSVFTLLTIHCHQTRKTLHMKENKDHPLFQQITAGGKCNAF